MQANIIMGSGGVERSNPDFYRLKVMNYILGGGGFSSRLVKVVRSEHGLAYSVDSGFEPGKFQGAFTVSLQTKNQSSNEAIDLILQQLREIQEKPVSDAELDGAKKFLIGSFPLGLERQSAIASFMVQVEFYGLGLDYAEQYPKLIGSVTKDDVLAVAKKYLHPDSMIVVAVANQATRRSKPRRWRRQPTPPARNKRDALIFTIGHSTHPIERFLELLGEHRIAIVADVRSFPSSKRWPQFNQAELSASLERAGIEYRWIKRLGGRRSSKRVDSPHTAWQLPAFRSYADYTESADFEDGMRELTDAAAAAREPRTCVRKDCGGDAIGESSRTIWWFAIGRSSTSCRLGNCRRTCSRRSRASRTDGSFTTARPRRNRECADYAAARWFSAWRRKPAVYDAFTPATSSGVPFATTWPPRSPPSGPRSIR